MRGSSCLRGHIKGAKGDGAAGEGRHCGLLLVGIGAHLLAVVELHRLLFEMARSSFEDPDIGTSRCSWHWQSSGIVAVWNLDWKKFEGNKA